MASRRSKRLPSLFSERLPPPVVPAAVLFSAPQNLTEKAHVCLLIYDLAPIGSIVSWSDGTPTSARAVQFKPDAVEGSEADDRSALAHELRAQD